VTKTCDLGDFTMKKLIGLCLLAILAGCAGNSPDTKVPSERCMQLNFDPSAKIQSIHLKDLSIELSPHYDKNRGIIEAKGQVTLDHDKIPASANVSNFKMRAYLLDKDYKILKKLSIRGISVKTADKDIPFELSFSYKSQYAYITFDYAFDFNYSFT